MYGGLTGFGMHPSLGGLLVGGARTPEQIRASQRASAEKRKLKTAPAKVGLYQYYDSMRPEGYADMKKREITMHAMRQIKSLEDAELAASQSPWGQDHPVFRDSLSRDAQYWQLLRDSGKRPAWIRERFSGQYRAPPSQERIDNMMAKRQASMLARQESGERRRLNTLTGRYIYPSSARGQKLAQQGLLGEEE